MRTVSFGEVVRLLVIAHFIRHFRGFVILLANFVLVGWVINALGAWLFAGF